MSVYTGNKHEKLIPKLDRNLHFDRFKIRPITYREILRKMDNYIFLFLKSAQSRPV
jgi:hypothetical protein